MRQIVAVIGSTRCNSQTHATAVELGKRLCDSGFRVATGGLGGVMEAALAGVRASERYREGDTVGVLPMYDFTHANQFVDIVIPTGLGVARNTILVAMACALVAIGGGAGTLAEIALASQLRKPVILLESTGGWTARLSKLPGPLDHRDSPLVAVPSIEDVLRHLETIDAGACGYEPCWT